MCQIFKSRIFLRRLIVTLVLVIYGCLPVLAMTESQKSKCHYIIHGAAAGAVATSALLSQAPGTDNIPLCIAVGGMTVALGQVFDYSLMDAGAEAIGTAIIADFAITIGARFATQWVFGWIPGIGNAVNSATAFAMIEFIGWEVADAFDKGDFSTLRKWKLISGSKKLWDLGKK